MSDRALHCPFLNRTDSRCGENFKLDHLQHAFKYCFDKYKACPTYLELLIERRVRRSVAVDAGDAAGAEKEPGRESRTPLVQVTVAHRELAEAARSAGFSPAPGR